MLAIAIITVFCLLLVVTPCIFAVMQFMRYKANGGKRNDFIGFCMDALREFN